MSGSRVGVKVVPPTPANAASLHDKTTRMVGCSSPQLAVRQQHGGETLLHSNKSIRHEAINLCQTHRSLRSGSSTVVNSSFRASIALPTTARAPVDKQASRQQGMSGGST